MVQKCTMDCQCIDNQFTNLNHVDRTKLLGETLAARGLKEPCASFTDFCDNRRFHVIYSTVFPLICTLFRRISDSRFTWIHDLEEKN